MKRFTLLISLILLTACMVLASCGGSASQETGGTAAGAPDMDAAERVLRAMTEFPSDELYHPSAAVTGQSASELTDAEKTAEQEKAAWQAAVGDCFADGKFDEFYDHYDRTGFLSEAYIIGLTNVVKGIDIADKEGSDNAKQVTLTLEATDTTGHVDTYDTVWLVTYDEADPQLLQSVELLVDGGYFCRAGCEIPGR